MEVKAVTKFLRLSPFKARDLARQLKGLPVAKALEITTVSKRKAAQLIGQTLKSAVANAENNNKVSADGLFVKEVLIEEGPRMRRYWPRSRGMVSPIIKRMSHIRVTIGD